MNARRLRGGFAGLGALLCAMQASAELPPHATVVANGAPNGTGIGPAAVAGGDVSAVEIAEGRGTFRPVAWGTLANTPRAPGLVTLKFRVTGVEAVEVPTCAGRRRILLDGAVVHAPHQGAAPAIVRLPDDGAHEIALEVAVSGYEKRVACGAAPRAGAVKQTKDGLFTTTFASGNGGHGGGRAVVYVPPGHDAAKPAALLVGAHPWDGSIWTYAAYEELFREANRHDVVLLMPSGLGNSLYTAAAEDEVLRAIDHVGGLVAIDARRVSIWGASMGGAGATTIGLHHPDRFASITSLFGDSRYDLGTYVRAILHDEAGAHAVNALDVVDNARHVPVWLIHGEDDRVSPVTQSSMLARALAERKYAVRFDRIPAAGHDGALVARFLPEIVARAAEARVPEHPGRVTFKSVREQDCEAYGVRIARAGGDALIDLERKSDGVHVLKASRVKGLVLTRGALGAPNDAPIVFDDGVAPIEARWSAAR